MKTWIRRFERRSRNREAFALDQLTPFVDFASLWNSDDVEIVNGSLPSLGLGLNFQVADRFNVRLDWGIPLSDVDGGDSLQESGLHFSLFSNLF